MNRQFIIGFCSVVTALSSYILPQLTGKTVITKMQTAVILIGAVGVVASNVKALLTPTKADVE